MSEDVVLITENRQISCCPQDREVLSKCSSYFERLFNGPWAERNKRTIDLKDSSNLHLLIDASLDDKHIDFNTADVFQILETASKYLFEDIQKLCEDHLLKLLNIENALKMFSLSDRLALTRLYQASRHIVLYNFNDVRFTAGFLEAELSTIYKYLSDDHLNVGQEYNVWEAIVSWLNHDTEREELLPEVFKCLRFQDLPIFDLQVILLDPELRQWKRCTELLKIIEKQQTGNVLSESETAEAESFLSIPSRSIPEKIIVVARPSFGRTFETDPCFLDVPHLLSYSDKHTTFSRILLLDKLGQGPFKCKSSGFSVFSMGTDIYLLGGMSLRDAISAVWKYNTFSKQWFHETTLPSPKQYQSVCVIENCFYVMGGLDERSRVCRKVYMYDTNLLRWKTCADLPLHVQNQPVCCFAYNNSVSLIDHDRFFVYRPDQNVWDVHQGYSLGTKSPFLISAMFFNEHIYFVANLYSSSKSRIYKCDPVGTIGNDKTLDATIVAELPQFTVSCACFVAPNWFLFCEHCDSLAVFCLNLQTDTLKNQWEGGKSEMNVFHSAFPLVDYDLQ